MANQEISRKKFAVSIEEQDEICNHAHVPWTGKMPCTGVLRCSMCGAEFSDRPELNQARQKAAYAAVDMGTGKDRFRNI